MEPENVEEIETADEEGPAGPVCIGCMVPVDPLDYYCPNCGEASGQLTQYIPFLNIRWMARVYGKMWRQLRSRDISILGRFFRVIIIVWCAPIILVGLFFKENSKPLDDESIKLP
jgi:hypothetical protein